MNDGGKWGMFICVWTLYLETKWFLLCHVVSMFGRVWWWWGKKAVSQYGSLFGEQADLLLSPVVFGMKDGEMKFPTYIPLSHLPTWLTVTH